MNSARVDTVILGLGKTGLSCARFLNRRVSALALTIADTRSAPPELATLREECPELPVFLGGFPSEIIAAAKRLIVSPGVPLTEPLIQQALARGVPVIGDIELFAQAVNAPVLAVTGANGKSTVVSLLGAMLQTAGWSAGVGGNLGLPALDLLQDAHRLYVLELSSFQLETTYSLTPLAATVLNISPDHLDRYPSLYAYIQTKARIYQGAALGVMNWDDPQVAAMRGLAAQEIGFNLSAPYDNESYGLMELAGTTWLCRGDQPLLPTADLALKGRHNLANALAALALGNAAGLPLDAMCQTLRKFQGLPHRTQLVAEYNGIAWYDDSKGTNVGATIAALEGLTGGSGRAILIAGGDGKGADFTPLASVVMRTCRAVVLIGRDAPQIAAALNHCVEQMTAIDLESAVAQAAHLAQPGDHVLLSPACASFDMFRDYRQRGELFAAAVQNLLT